MLIFREAEREKKENIYHHQTSLKYKSIKGQPDGRTEWHTDRQTDKQAYRIQRTQWYNSIFLWDFVKDFFSSILFSFSQKQHKWNANENCSHLRTSAGVSVNRTMPLEQAHEEKI